MRSIDKILSKSGSSGAKAVKAQAKEHRFAPRRTSALPALIHVENSPATIPCLVRDISSTGARLELRENWFSSYDECA